MLVSHLERFAVLSAAQAAQKIFNQLVRCGYMLSAAQAAQKSDEKSHT